MTSLLAPTATTTLADLPAATSAYIHEQVKVKVGAVTEKLQTDEDGTFTIRWTNPPAPDGVRLREVMLHLTVSPESVATIKVPGGAAIAPRLINDINSPRPANDSRVGELFVFLLDIGDDSNPINSTLAVGETAELEFGYHAEGVGHATLSAHIHATVAFEDLFPRDRGDAGTKSIDVIAG
ncbi:MAG: hypothetical protein ABJD68_11765 [Nakamurella sp.]